jgi:hypothetical protein
MSHTFTWPHKSRVMLLIRNRMTRFYLPPAKRIVCAKPFFGYGLNFIVGILIYGNVRYKTYFL